MSEWKPGDLPPTDQAPPTPAAPLAPRLRLLVVDGPDRGALLEVARGAFVVGKAPDCDLVLSDRQVSRHHLELVVSDESIVLRDLESLNGSFCRGSRIKEITVEPGTRFKVGGSELSIESIVEHGLPPSQAERFGSLRGASLPMREMFALLERAAPSDIAVLLQGETGTGKEECALALHAASARKNGPLVVCDLAGISRTLLEAELFGHVRGAFTGAIRDQAGAFERAHGGTIFLDEIGELELADQPRLLRAIERRQVKPVGGNDYRDIDVRVIAATNRDLVEEVRAGRFRQDLYHRLEGVLVKLPPLRARRDDIPLLIEHFLSGRGVRISSEAVALLSEYHWPGNVRELKHALDRAVSLLGGAKLIEPVLLGLEVPSVGAGDDDDGFRMAKERLVAAWERDYLAKLLARAGGNVSEAARRAGIDRAYLHRLLKKHGLGND